MLSVSPADLANLIQQTDLTLPVNLAELANRIEHVNVILSVSPADLANLIQLTELTLPVNLAKLTNQPN